MRRSFNSLVRALGFLSRLPLPSGPFAEAPDAPLSGDAGAFALAGVVIALPAALVLALAASMLAPLPAAMLALITMTALTGALHEDGLADCADAFFSPHPVERRLEIMKDSRIGTFGALALVFQFALGAAALAAILEAAGTWPAAAAMVAAAALSRAGIVWHWHVLPFARPGGLAAGQGRPGWNAVVLGAASAAAIAGLMLSAPFGLGGLAAALTAALTGAFCAMVLARAKIGGQTGDTLGLTQKAAELFVLLALAAGL